MSSQGLKLLLVEDDDVLRERLALSLRKRGHTVATAGSINLALAAAESTSPDAAVVDLRLGNDSGLRLVPLLRERNAAMRIVVLTGYGSIATALEAVRLGAADYLTKPADADQIERALLGRRADETPAADIPSLDRVEWEHMQRVLADCGHNITRAAALLGIDRRSLQRKLGKYPPPR